MVIGILQPSYLPWLGYFEQIYRSDVFVLYDDVQYDKHGWRNRNKIKTPKGTQWLTVPVYVNFNEYPLINEVKICNTQNWRRKHLLSIKHNYNKAPYYKDYIGIFEEAYSKNWEYLVDINIYFINKIIECLGIKNKKIVRSSMLGIEGDRINRLINICKLFKADIFYEGSAGRNYINEKIFAENGIKVIFQDYKHPVYNQLYGEFIPYLSIIDLLFNHGRESLSILTNQKGVV